MDTIVSKDTWKAGDACLYFANGGVISPEYLKTNNLYRHSDLNSDENKSGYFEDNGRVKTMKLRGEMSDGIIMHPHSLQEIISIDDIAHLTDGQEIDKIGNFTLAQKYIPKYANRNSAPRAGTKKNKRVKYMAEHIDTSQLNYNLRRFEGPCEVSVSFKLHGTSGRFAHLRRPWWKFWQPKFVSGSRRVEFQSFDDGGFYGDNEFRRYYHQKLSKIIPAGYVIYFEIVGWVNDNTPIMPIYNTNKLDKELQKEFGPQMIFSYGCKQGEHEMYVYRITHNDRELSPEEIFYFCEDRELKVVPFCIIPSRPGWHDWTPINGVEELEEALKYQFENYHDRLDPSHLLEGVVVRRKNELGTWEAYKLKTNEFKIIDDIENSGMKPENVSQDVLEEMS